LGACGAGVSVSCAETGSGDCGSFGPSVPVVPGLAGFIRVREATSV
jgi:hypothetical protein